MSGVTVPDDRELERLAVEELLREARRGALRAESQGPQGWLKCPLPKTNKKFLTTTIRNAIASNNYRQRKLAEKRSISPPKSQPKSKSESKGDSNETKKHKKRRHQ